MQGGFPPPTGRHAVPPTSIARDSGSLPKAPETCGERFNTLVAQSALHARGRNWSECWNEIFAQRWHGALIGLIGPF